MMKPRELFRALVPALFLAVAPLLSHCGGDVQLGTETGNPPGLQQMKLYLEVVADGLRVVGTPGAVAPPGAAVRVTNVSTGESVEARAGADGSLDVVIAGDAGDQLEVTAASAGQELSERISLSAIGGRTSLSGVSCSALESTLLQTMTEVFDGADTSCAADVDCVPAGWAVASNCSSGCSIAILSRSGAALATSQGVQRTAAVCAALDSCDRPTPAPCPLPIDIVPVCRAGRCAGVAPTRLTCDDLVLPAATRRNQLRDAAEKSCAEAADCSLANIAVSCLGDCGSSVESVAQSAVATLEASISDEVEVQYCAPAFAYGCSAPSVDCNPPTGNATAVCEAGACAVRYVE